MFFRVVITPAFLDGMYQWAATLTSSAQNMPFSLPLQADRTPDGFDIAFLRVIEGKITRTARICCVVERVAEVSLPLTLDNADEGIHC